MVQLNEFQEHVDRAARDMEREVLRIYEGLEQLAALTITLLQEVPAPKEEVDAWIQREFIIDEEDYFERESVLTSARAGDIDPQQFSFYVHRRFHDDPETLRRMYILRKLGRRLQPLRDRLGGLEWFFYQDRAGWALAFPMHNPSGLIPADFDWLNYFTFQAVNPEANPTREIRYPPPNIDYAGKGLMITPSIPVYLDDDSFAGVWSIDVPVARLLKGVQLDLPVEGCETFIVENSGQLVAHKRIAAIIGEDKGNFSRESISSLGGDFATLPPEEFFAQARGVRELNDAKDERLVCAHRVIEELRWCVVATIPVRQLLETTRRSFGEAFAHLGRGNLSHRLDLEVGGELQTLVDGYNEMVARLTATLEEREREQKNRQEIQRLQVIGQLAGSVAHDFNNLLTVIISSATLLQLGGLQSQHLQHIQTAAERASALTTQLLAFGKRGPIAPLPLDLGRFCADHQNFLRRLIPEGLTLTLQVDTNASVRLDRTQALQILLNLVLNATQAVQADGCISLRVTEDAQEVELSVSDDGAGIDPDVKDKIFDAFFTTKSTGTGLGLSMVHEIVSAADGQISVESTPTQGSTFRLRFPKSDEAEPEQPVEPPNKTLEGLRILVLDDEKLLRETTVETLRHLGAHAVEYAHAKGILEELQEGSWDILLSDVVMPGISGREVLEHARAIDPDLPILFISGYTDDTLLLHGVGDQTILRKPFTLDELRTAIQRLVTSR